MIDPQMRCSACFFPSLQSGRHCLNCKKMPSLYYKSAAVFDYFGPAASLVKKLKYGNRPDLAKGMAAYLAVQFFQLDWPLPDALVCVPIPFTRWLDRGYNQSFLLAKELSYFLKVPLITPLSRASGDLSQAALSLEQRRLLTSQSFKLKRPKSVIGKNLLVIDDVATSGTTLQRCAEKLLAGSAATLYALTFCKTALDRKNL